MLLVQEPATLGPKKSKASIATMSNRTAIRRRESVVVRRVQRALTWRGRVRRGGLVGGVRRRHALHGARGAGVVVQLLHRGQVHRVRAAQRREAHLLLARRRARLQRAAFCPRVTTPHACRFTSFQYREHTNSIGIRPCF